MIPSSACQPWRADQPGNAGEQGGQRRQLHHAVGHDLRQDAAVLFGSIVAKRNAIGRPITQMDAMIAAICLVHGATLATRNARDFDGLDLRLVNPFEAGA